MKNSWHIKFYEDINGDMPVKKCIDALDIHTQAKVDRSIALLEEFGIELRMPLSKKLIGTNLRELRLLGKGNIRIFYSLISETSFLLLHCFKKKTNKTPKKEILLAIQRLGKFRQKI